MGALVLRYDDATIFRPSHKKQAPALKDWCNLIEYDKHGEKQVIAAALYRFHEMPFADALEYVKSLKKKEMAALAETLLGKLGKFDIPLRELEYCNYTFDLVMDQGAYAEFKRHRMMSQTPQRLTTRLGYSIPKLVTEAGFGSRYEAAMEAAQWVEKVRITPGNYADSKKFAVREYSDEQYDAELRRIEERFTPLVLLCKKLNRAMRIGTNHGSLSDRIMNRYGDSPLGMVESALEFAQIARQHDYHNFVFSMKASNPKVAIECYRLLVVRLDVRGPEWYYPIHLGVTVAGDGEDGRM